ncbi:hypothetical protein ACFSX9_13760 [Flavobacterium ardleyense]|uniref:Uncharacterized protein n=1 Tax=Flavobacterium ardleyense TaxID=2038737 RepID=A0ABW5ZA83_9FLAO
MQDNEKTLFFAIARGLNEEEVMKNFDRNLNYILKRLTLALRDAKENDNKFNLFFSARFNRTLFPKLNSNKRICTKIKTFYDSFIY